MKPPNWVCSKLLASALLSLPSGSAELLYTKATVAKAFSRSEPFPRAGGGEGGGEKSDQPIRKSGIWDIIERNLSEPSWVGGNLCSFIKVNETETVYTHRGPGPDFIWSGPATCLTSHRNTARKESFHRSWGSNAGWRARPIWSIPTLGIQQGPARPWGQAILDISWVRLDSQDPVPGKTRPIWEVWLNRNARVWASALHFSPTLGILAGFIPLPTPESHPHSPQHQVPQMIWAVIFNGKAGRGGDTGQRRSTLHGNPEDFPILHCPRVYVASAALLNHQHLLHFGCGLGRPEPPRATNGSPYLLLMPAAWL